MFIIESCFYGDFSFSFLEGMEDQCEVFSDTEFDPEDLDAQLRDRDVAYTMQ